MAISLLRTPSSAGEQTLFSPALVRIFVVCGVLLTLLVYGICLFSSWPTLLFSPDSWSYQELARSIGSDHPYRFSTFRSYWSYEYSAAFPPAFPTLLWALHGIFGPRPEVGILLNILVAFITPWAICHLSRKAFGLPYVGLFPAIALLLFPSYVFEVFSAGAIPLAILCSIAGLSKIFGSKTSLQSGLAGFLLGFAIILRFDQLILWGLCGILLLYQHRKPLNLVCYGIGGLIAVSPWIIFSMSHFGTPWASDNSWVALSSHKAYVIDYPASSIDTIFTHPLVWATKFAGNLKQLAATLCTASYRFPYLVVIAGYLVFRLIFKARGASSPATFAALAIPGIALAGLLPQAMTGYFDPRYFSIFYLLAALSLTWMLVVKPASQTERKISMIILFVALAGNSLMALNYATDLARSRPARVANAVGDEQLLKKLADEHAKEPEILYIFGKGSSVQVCKYGALFQRRGGFLPSNWASLTDLEKDNFEKEFGPLRYIDWRKGSLPIARP